MTVKMHEAMQIFIRPLAVLTLVLLPVCAAAQSGPPTRTATPSTAAETATIEAGIKLHDAGKFEDAIAKYEEVLKLSPANMTALYELAYSFAANKEYEKSLAAAMRGTEYQSPELPLFYDLLGGAYDSLSEPQKAIEAYRKGIQIVPDASMLYYNMGVTYLESLKNPDEARRAIERAVALDPAEPEFHLMLGQVFQSNGYAAPAFLAFSTYLILEPNGPRALSAYGFWRAMLRGGVEMGRNATPDGQMRTPPPAPGGKAAKVDEGDFSEFEAAITKSEQAVIAEMDRGAEELPPFVAQVKQLIAMLAQRAPESDRTRFASSHYVPFFAELNAKHYVEPFIYWSMQRAPVTGVRDWLTTHQAEVKEFVAWSRDYKWTKP
jgi:tetratricopeptide (TPR) repeat protein